uniref:Uncharacterized protein n=1 Tax=Romanomermis culicivorax TaxID=13658 RepID=A0A915IX80_ROMCU
MLSILKQEVDDFKLRVTRRHRSYLPFSAERNGMQSTERNGTERKFLFSSVRLELAIGPSLPNRTYTFQSKSIHFQMSLGKK